MLLTVLIYIASLANAASVTVSASRKTETVTVRILINEGRRHADDDSLICTLEEVAAIQRILVAAVDDRKSTHKNLRPSHTRTADSLHCDDLCRGFDAGTCWLVDPACSAVSPFSQKELRKSPEPNQQKESSVVAALSPSQQTTCQRNRNALMRQFMMEDSPLFKPQKLSSTDDISPSCQKVLREQQLNLSCLPGR